MSPIVRKTSLPEIPLEVEQAKAPSSPVKIIELGGILIYDSQAYINGQATMTQYYKENSPKPLNPYILFEKDEVDRVTQEFFQAEARERDFATDLDKQFY